MIDERRSVISISNIICLISNSEKYDIVDKFKFKNDNILCLNYLPIFLPTLNFFLEYEKTKIYKKKKKKIGRISSGKSERVLSWKKIKLKKIEMLAHPTYNKLGISDEKN